MKIGDKVRIEELDGIWEIIRKSFNLVTCMQTKKDENNEAVVSFKIVNKALIYYDN